MAVNSYSQGFPLSICLWTPIRQAPMCPNHNNKFYVVVICPTNQSMFYKLVHPKDKAQLLLWPWMKHSCGALQVLGASPCSLLRV